MRTFLGGLDVFFTSARMQFAAMTSFLAVALAGVIQPVAFLLITLLPIHDPTVAQNTTVASSVLLTSFWSSTVWGAASILRIERAQGTLVKALTGVRDPRIVVLAKGLTSSVVSIVSVMVTVSVCLALLARPISIQLPLLYALGLAITALSGAAVGLLVGSVFVLTRHGAQVSSALMYPIFLLGGMMIPLSAVPSPLSWVSGLVSLRWIQEFLVSAAAGAPHFLSLTIASALTLAYGMCGFYVFKLVVIRARRDGEIDFI